MGKLRLSPKPSAPVKLLFQSPAPEVRLERRVDRQCNPSAHIPREFRRPRGLGLAFRAISVLKGLGFRVWDSGLSVQSLRLGFFRSGVRG